ncbi:MAG: YgeY family selenium metabolism-linked hydrolase [Spirochaetes bacterium]|nr:YgeY family selenium metabolism-linked hydrolase [Spirochaetota bacterium]
MKVKTQIRSLATKYGEYTARNLSEIVRIPSLSCEEKRVVERLAELCRDAGFDEVRTDGLGNLIGRVGNGKRVLAIDAHIDTVDTGDINLWDFDPLSGELKKGFVLGRGTADQKGGAASMITAGRILKEIGYEGLYTVLFTFTVMEEDCDGLCWRYLIEREKIVPDLAVITEPTNLGVFRGHRGRMEMELSFSGRSAHGSMPELGVNAVYRAAEAVRRIEKLNETLASDEFLGPGSVAVTMISSKSPSLCAIPDGCLVHLDRRLTWGETLESAIEGVREAVGKDARIEVPGYDRASYLGTTYPQKRYFPTWKLEPGSAPVQAAVRTCSELWDREPVVGKWTFSTNGVAICGTHGIPCIGFGPGDEALAHAPNERIKKDQLEAASAFYALLPFILERD